MCIRLCLVALVVATLLPEDSSARVVKFEVEERTPFAQGETFGEAGAYKRLDGTAYFEVDPKDPLNAVIVNLDMAPRNARGMVEFSTPFVILKPIDMARSNRKIWYGINNRGFILDLQQRSLDPTPSFPFTNAPSSKADVGSNLLPVTRATMASSMFSPARVRRRGLRT